MTNLYNLLQIYCDNPLTSDKNVVLLLFITRTNKKKYFVNNKY